MKIDFVSFLSYEINPNLFHLVIHEDTLKSASGDKNLDVSILQAHRIACKTLSDELHSRSQRSLKNHVQKINQSCCLPWLSIFKSSTYEHVKDSSEIKFDGLKALMRRVFLSDLQRWVEGAEALEKRQEAAKKILDAFEGQSRFLSLNSLHLKTLPDCLGWIPSLMELMVSENQLTQLPETLGNLQHLKTLWLKHNRLESLPQSFSLLESLEYLHAQDNGFQEVPSQLYHLPKLQCLFLGQNRISHMPEGARHLQALEELTLDDNRLVLLPESLCNLTYLRRLEVSHNPISELPSAIGALSFLSYLGIRGNHISHLPESLFNLQADIHAENNRFELEVAQDIAARLRQRQNSRLRLYYDVYELGSSQPRPKAKTLSSLIQDFYLLAELTFSVEKLKGLDSEKLTNFLERLPEMASFKNSSKVGKKLLSQKIVSALEQMQKNTDFLATSLDIMEEALGFCGDRITIGFNRWIEAFEITKLSHESTLFEVAAYLISAKRKHIIESLAASRGGDQVETALRIQILLKERLKLCIASDEMLYPGIANFRIEELEAVYEDIKQASSDFFSILKSAELWRSHLRKLKFEDYQAIANSYAFDTSVKLEEQYAFDTKQWLEENAQALHELVN